MTKEQPNCTKCQCNECTVPCDCPCGGYEVDDCVAYVMVCPIKRDYKEEE